MDGSDVAILPNAPIFTQVTQPHLMSFGSVNGDGFRRNDVVLKVSS